MRRQLKRLGSDTAIYGVSTILGRALNFLLLPFYTNVLLPGEYGIVSYLFSIIAFVTVFYSYGMESAYFRYSSSLEVGTPKDNFSTPVIALFSTSVVLTTLIVLLAQPIAAVMHIQEGLASIVYIAAGVLFFDTLALIPYAALRMEHRPRVFAAIKVATIFVTVALNILLLVVLKMGVMGILLSNLIASACAVCMLIPTIRRNFTPAVNRTLLKSLVRFGLPFIPAGIATMAVQVIDRPILRALTDDATVGVYQANYRLGIFMMLVVQMYDFAWRPFYFANANEPNAKQLFARVLTYFSLLMSGIFLVISFFVGDAVKLSLFGHHIIHPNYWSGLSIVPIILAGYMFLGVSNNLSAGIYLRKKTSYMPLIAFTGAAVNIVANFGLIPFLGMTGAAWATFLAYAVMAIVMYVIVRRIYPVPYEFGRLAKIALALIVVYGLFMLIPIETYSFVNSLAVRISLLAVYCMMMFFMKFFEPAEWKMLKGIFSSREDASADPLSAEELEEPKV